MNVFVCVSCPVFFFSELEFFLYKIYIQISFFKKKVSLLSRGFLPTPHTQSERKLLFEIFKKKIQKLSKPHNAKEKVKVKEVKDKVFTVLRLCKCDIMYVFSYDSVDEYKVR